MMRWFFSVILVGAFSIWHLPLHAQALTGKQLFESCASALRTAANSDNASISSVVNQLVCSNYLSGYVDAHAVTHNIIDSRRGGDNRIYCSPKEGLTPLQMMQAIVLSASSDPKLIEDSSARVFVMVALGRIYPCP